MFNPDPSQLSSVLIKTTQPLLSEGPAVFCKEIRERHEVYLTRQICAVKQPMEASFKDPKHLNVVKEERLDV